MPSGPVEARCSVCVSGWLADLMYSADDTPESNFNTDPNRAGLVRLGEAGAPFARSCTSRPASSSLLHCPSASFPSSSPLVHLSAVLQRALADHLLEHDHAFDDDEQSTAASAGGRSRTRQPSESKRTRKEGSARRRRQDKRGEEDTRRKRRDMRRTSTRLEQQQAGAGVRLVGPAQRSRPESHQTGERRRGQEKREAQMRRDNI